MAGTDESRLREELVTCSRILVMQGILGFSGHVSARIGHDRLLIQPRDLSRAALTPKDLLVVDLDGEEVSGDGKYAGGSTADASSAYDALKAADTYPVSAPAFSQSSAVAQERLAKQVGAITTAPDPSQWLDMTPWTTAVADMHIGS
jgi:hypothetical protein